MFKPAIQNHANGEFYALAVKVEKDGTQTVLRGYKGRYFKTEKAAKKSVNNYLTKQNYI